MQSIRYMDETTISRIPEMRALQCNFAGWPCTLNIFIFAMYRTHLAGEKGVTLRLHDECTHTSRIKWTDAIHTTAGVRRGCHFNWIVVGPNVHQPKKKSDEFYTRIPHKRIITINVTAHTQKKTGFHCTKYVRSGQSFCHFAYCISPESGKNGWISSSPNCIFIATLSEPMEKCR